MANYYAEAVEIITDTGNGIPVTYTNTAIGLASDGHFYLISGRFGLNGSKSITGDTPRTVWYEGILAKDFSATISRNADFVEAGCLETVSGFNFPIVNTGAFWSTLKTNGVNLAGRRVKYYRVTSSDLATFNFELRWSGIIGEQPFNDLTYTIQCLDNSRDIFKSLPVQSVTASRFEDAPEDSQDKNIPIALGRVARSPLVNIRKPGAKTVLVTNDGRDFNSCGMTAYNESTKAVTLYTLGVSFSANDPDLVDSHLNVVSGGTEQSVLIVSNTATSGSSTVVTVEDYLDTSAGAFVPYAIGVTNETMWWAEVQKLTATLIASTKPISEFSSNPAGRTTLATWDPEFKRYSDASDIKRISDVDDVAETGLPGVDVVAKDIDSNGVVTSFYKIAAETIELHDLVSASYDGPGVGLAQPSLNNSDRFTGYTLTDSGASGIIEFEVTLPQAALNQTFDELYLGIDLQQWMTSGSNNMEISVSAQGVDIYGQETASILAATPLWNLVSDPAVTTSPVNVHTLHGVYFNSPTTPTRFYERKDNLSITSVFENIKTTRCIPKIRVTLTVVRSGAGAAWNVFLQEIGFTARRSINVNEDQIYTGLIGETFGTTWDGRKTASAAITNPVDALEHLIRNYDTSDPVWEAATAYVIGSTVRGTADTRHIFVCTTAGTSHASSEPTWADTAGTTYADGTVTWRELREIPIHTASFDAASTQRTDWFIGRTLTEKKKSEAYYKDLCAQCFLIMTMDAFGRVKLKAWRENTTPLITFDSSNIIERTIGEVKPTPMGQVYNDLLIRYDDNPGSQKFNRRIFATNIDKPAFPAEIGAWREYVGGIDDYTVANDLWDDLHESFQIAKTINKLPDELGNCRFFIDPKAMDAEGNYIWSVDGVTLDAALDVGDAHSAVLFAQNLAAWTAKPKDQVHFEAHDNAAHSALEIGDPVEVNDVKATGGIPLLGWIHEKTQLPAEENGPVKIPPRFRFGVTLEPT